MVTRTSVTGFAIVLDGDKQGLDILEAGLCERDVSSRTKRNSRHIAARFDNNLKDRSLRGN